MTVQIKHQFTSLKGDGSDLTQIQPSNWNATHTLTQASGKVLGRVTSGVGVTEEIDWSAFGRSFLNAANASAALGLLGPVSVLSNQSVAYKNLQLASAAARILGSNINPALNILGTANNGGGLIRLTVGSTATFDTGQTKVVAGVVGTTEANDSWVITVVDATHIDLQGSVFANNYVSGGTIGAGFEEKTISQILDFFGGVVRGDIIYRGAAAWDRKVLGPAGYMLRSDGTDLNYVPDGFGALYAHFQYAVTANTNGGSLGASDNTFYKRTISAAVANNIGAVLASSVLTLLAGTYLIEVIAHAQVNLGNGKLRLRNTSDNTTTIVGLTSKGVTTFDAGGQAGASHLMLKGYFTIAATKNFEIQQAMSSNTNSSDAQGGAYNIGGEPEVYMNCFISKVA